MPYEFRLPPYNHQLKAWEESKDKVNWAYFMEMGTGKSLVMINVGGWLFEQGKIDAIVYIAKKGEYANFSRYEIPAHLPDRIAREMFTYSSTRMKLPSVQREFRSLIKPGRHRLPILLVNIEALILGASVVLEDFYKAHKRILFLLDESTCAKHYDSKRSKQVYYWAARSTYRRIATGTAVTQAPMDLYGQCLAISKTVLGYSSYFAFRNTFCKIEIQYLGSRSFQKVVGYKNLDQLSAKLSTFSHRILKKDCLDLPEKIYTQRVVPLTPKQEALYSQLRDEALIELQGHELEVVNVLAQLVKLHQIVCGQLKVGVDDYISIENERLGILVDLLDNFDGKAIIWASYRQSLADVVKVLGEKFGKESTVAYYGDISAKERELAVESFKHGSARFFVANPQSAGFGLTLTEASLVIYYCNSYNLEHRLQSEDRAHRIGQTRAVTYVDLVSPNTVDERIMEVLRSKKQMSDLIMERPITQWL